MNETADKTALARLYFTYGFRVEDVSTCLRDAFGSALSVSTLITIRRSVPNAPRGKPENCNVLTRNAIEIYFFRKRVFEMLADFYPQKYGHFLILASNKIILESVHHGKTSIV